MHDVMSRRRFVASALAAGAAVPAAVPAADTEPRTKRKYRFIDIHTHVGTFYWGKELNAFARDRP
jgi:hypothetical protein